MIVPTYEEILERTKKEMISHHGMCKKCGWYPKPFGIVHWDGDKCFCPDCDEVLEDFKI